MYLTIPAVTPSSIRVFKDFFRRQWLVVMLLAVWAGGSAQALTTTATYDLVEVINGVNSPKLIAGKAFIPWIAKGTLPPGSTLRSVSINATLQGVESTAWVSDLCVYVDPTPETPGGDGVLQVGGSVTQGDVSTYVDWSGGDNKTIGSQLVDQKSTPAHFPANIDLNTAGLFLSNADDADAHWSGSVSVTYDLVGPADILSFGLSGIVGVIGDTTIALTVPYGTDVTQLAPSYTMASGATCPKASGSTQNFTDPVTYAVTSAGGTLTKNYVVTVTVQQGLTARTYDTTYGSSSLTSVANLLSTPPSGSMNQISNIDYNANFATSFPGLTDNNTFTILWEGWFVVGKDGAGAYTFGTNSDDGSVIYMDLNNDGDFTDSNECIVNNNGDHTARSVTGTVTLNLDLNLVHTVIGYYNYSNSNLMAARFKLGNGLDYAALNPINGSSGYFIPNLPPDGPASADMTSFGLPGNRAGIIGTQVTLLVPFGTDVTALSPDYTVSSLARQDAAHLSGSQRDFSSPQTYTITAQNNATKVYTVTVIKAAGNPDKNIEMFGPGGSIATDTINWIIPYGIVRSTLAPVYTVSPLATEDALHPSGSQRDFTNPQTYTITAQDGSTKTYTVTVVWGPGNSDKDILSFGPGAVITGTNIAWTVPYAADLKTLAPTYTHSNLAVGDATYPSGSVRDFTTPQVYRITAQDLSTKDYTVTVGKVPASTAKDIVSFGPGGVFSGVNIAWTVPFGTDVRALAPVYTVSPLAREDPTYPSGMTRNFSTPQTYTVTAEDGSTRIYTVTAVVVSKSSAKEMLSFGPGAVINGTQITWTLPYGTHVTGLAPTCTQSPLASVSPPSATARNFSTPQNYAVTAEDGSVQVYTVTVVTPDTLCAYLPLDGNFNEIVNGNDLTPGSTAPTFVTGQIGQAAKLTTTANASRAITTGLPTGDSEFSWSAWLILDSTVTGLTPRKFLNWGPAGVNQFCAAGVTPSTGLLVNDHASNTQTFTYQPVVASGTFVHLALVYQNSGGVREQRLYVNGMLSSSVTLTGIALDLQNSNLILGGMATGLNKINAQVDDVGIWKSMLPERRIAATYGLAHFSNVPLNDSSIGQVIAMNAPGQAVTNVGPNLHKWIYKTNLTGVTGTTSGSAAGQNASIVLDGSAGTGIGMAASTAAPEISVDQAGTQIPDGGTQDFGVVAIGANASLIFTIRNTGSASLTGLALTKDGSQPNEFTVISNPAASVSGPSGTTSFTIRFAPTAAGVRSAVLHIANNDGDEAPYDIVLMGSSAAPSAPFATWIDAFTSIPVADRDPGDDPDHDGSSNLAEFAFDGVPNDAGNRGQFFSALKDNGDADTAKELTLTCAVRRSVNGFAADANNAQTATIDGVTYIIEGSSTLSGPWDGPISYLGKSNIPPSGSGMANLTGTDWEYCSFSAFNTLSGKGFLRARATKLP